MSYCQHGGGVTRHDFGYGRATGDPGPRPFHILGEVKKKQTHSYTHVFPISKIVPIHILFQILLIHILFGWKRYPIDILLRWKSYPFIYLDAWKSSRTSVYTLIMEVTPPPVTANNTTGFRGGWYPGHHLPPPPALHGKIRGNGPGSTKVSVQCILSYRQVHIFPCRAPLPGGKVHTKDSRYPWTLWTPQTNLDVIGLRSVAFVPVSMYLKWYTFIKTER